jgi:hypothetical protein
VLSDNLSLRLTTWALCQIGLFVLSRLKCLCRNRIRLSLRRISAAGGLLRRVNLASPLRFQISTEKVLLSALRASLEGRAGCQDGTERMPADKLCYVTAMSRARYGHLVSVPTDPRQQPMQKANFHHRIVARDHVTHPAPTSSDGSLDHDCDASTALGHRRPDDSSGNIVKTTSRVTAFPFC